MKLAFVGHMSKDSFEHSIPNAFMASTPAGHPFWLKPLEFIQEHIGSSAYNTHPEELTGPVALRTCVKDWEKGSLNRYADGVFDRVEVLENGKVSRRYLVSLSFLTFVYRYTHSAGGIHLSSIK
jgi:mannosyltransferase OCH1-like enzyme